MRKLEGLLLGLVLASAGVGANARAQDVKKPDAKKQDAETPEQQLARGQLVAESEHDYERALKILEKVAGDGSAKGEVRAQAMVAAARCLNQLGRGVEARAQLEAASALNGPAAQEAKRLLEAGLTDQQLELRIAKAIEELFDDRKATPDRQIVNELRGIRTAQDLVWVGAPAVPRLVRVLNDADHLVNVTGAAYLLARINSDAAAAALREAAKRSDSFYKRAVLAALIDAEPAARSDPARAAVMSMLQDPDPRVRQSVLTEAETIATNAEILPLTKDAEDATRIAAWNALATRLGTRSRRNWEQADELLVTALRRCLEEDRDPVRKVAVNLLSASSVLLLETGRTLFVESLADEALTREGERYRSEWIQSNQSAQVAFGVPIPLDLIVRVARDVSPSRTLSENGIWSDQGDPRAGALAGIVQRSSELKSKDEARFGWPATEHARAADLVALGFGSWMKNWIASNTAPDEVPSIAEAFAKCGDAWTLSYLLNALRANLTPTQRSAVAKTLIAMFDADDTRWQQSKLAASNPSPRWSSILQQLIAIGDDAADARVIRVFTATPDLVESSFESLLTRTDAPIEPRRLVELVTISGTKQSSNSVARSRNTALGRIAAAHLPELPRLLAKCYELGLEVSGGSSSREGYSSVGIQWMLMRNEARLSDTATQANAADADWAATSGAKAIGNWAPSYSEAELRTAFEACVATRSEQFWWSVERTMKELPKEGPFDPVASAFLELSLRHVPDAVPGAGKRAMQLQIMDESLHRAAPGWQDFALANVLDDELGERIIDDAPSITPAMLQRVREATGAGDEKVRLMLVKRLAYSRPGDRPVGPSAVDFLRDPSERVRTAAIGAAFVVAPDKALELALPLAKDAAPTVREALCTALGSAFDRRSIPVLIDALQDPIAGVREAAKKSLDSVQYVFEQKEKWKRLLQDGGLDASNAAEALVKQAATGQPKATRLVAIESLGTLGVAETLPVLIQFMADSDAEIAAAAKASIERINRRGTDKDSKSGGN